MTKTYDLIGGQSHGVTASIADSENTYDAPVYAGEDREKPSSHNETYTRREFRGEEFGDGYECFGLASDDETETEELARITLKVPVETA